ncbi:hypothetical protein L6270_01095 [Candidatus Parcubacteria bacterium]|nr:hypothetical protein [Patescibacteria group bacterium]MBU4309742.1 hypothetical protein [Patescibacteria group bacterium]MBU4431651.1 hypothetical protein [Patescibacteria group bacterium]MBU4578081.1 hypothetical protein [Patescibacteria group bacterium]MCG2696619.1 hypothetical protein [Candidatus Parcubacteria bacterium]
MKKIIQVLLIIILVTFLILTAIAIFNPLNLRTKFIGSIINSYLSSNIKNYSPTTDSQNIATSSTSTSTSTESSITGTSADKHPLLNENQEKTLESFGVNVSQLPTSITAGMQTCFIEKLGTTRAYEIMKGDTPSVVDFFKAKDCIGK